LSRLQEVLGKVQTLNELSTARAEIERQRQNLIEKDPEKYQTSIAAYTSAMDYIDSRTAQHSQDQMKAAAAVDAVGMNFLEKISQMAESSGMIGEHSVNLMGGLTSQLSTAGVGIDEATVALQQLQSTMANDNGFRTKVQGWEQAIQSFYDATDDESRLAAMEQIQTEFQGIASSIREVLSASGMGDEQIQAIISSWEQAQYAGLGFKTTTEGTVEVMSEAEMQASGLTEEIENTGYAWQKATDSMSEFANELRALDGEMNTLEKGMEQLAETGNIDVGTMADLLEAYPELIAHVGDYDAMMGAMTDRHGVLTDQMKDN